MPNQTQTLLRIEYRTEKSALAMMDREFAAGMDAAVAAVYERKKANVGKLERLLGKEKAASK